MDERVIIRLYDPAWPVCFEQERAAIVAVLQIPPASVHHVGSTAVPGLAAKAVIDMLVESPIFPPDADMIGALSRLGYEHRGEAGVPGRHWFRRGCPRSHHVHIVAIGSDVGLQMIQLRDWLRAHPDDAQAYEQLKRRAAAGRTIDSSDYARAKSELIARILNRVRAGG